ncbi:15946_t:CDS:1, partial [Dentiscutata erythropus]
SGSDGIILESGLVIGGNIPKLESESVLKNIKDKSEFVPHIKSFYQDK